MINSISNILRQTAIVIYYTLKELIKSKILITIFLLGGLLFIISYVAYSFTYGVPERVALDVGLGMISLSSVGLAIFMGVTLIAREVEQRTIYMVLARPINRTSFLLGRLGGLMVLLLINIFTLGAITLSFYSYLGGSVHSLIFWTLFFTFIESLLLLLLVVFFSLVVNPVLSVLFTLTLFIVGHGVSETLVTRFAQQSPTILFILKSYLWLFPNFERLNFKDYVLYQQNLEWPVISFSLAYGLLYSLILLLVSLWIFNKRNLD